MTARADFTYKIGHYMFQWGHGQAQAVLAGERFLVLDRSYEEEPIYESGSDHPIDWAYSDIYSWRVESLDHEEKVVVHELESRLWFYSPEEAIADFEEKYFTEVIQEDPV